MVEAQLEDLVAAAVEAMAVGEGMVRLIRREEDIVAVTEVAVVVAMRLTEWKKA